jgi:hypothetical protein
MVIVGQEVTASPTGVQRLAPLVETVKDEMGRYPTQLSADAGYASESNLLVCGERGVDTRVALRRFKHDEPRAADPAPAGGAAGAGQRGDGCGRSWGTKALTDLPTRSDTPVTWTGS